MIRTWNPIIHNFNKIQLKYKLQNQYVPTCTVSFEIGPITDFFKKVTQIFFKCNKSAEKNRSNLKLYNLTNDI